LALCRQVLRRVREEKRKTVNVWQKWLRHFCHHWYFPPQPKSPLFVVLWLEGRVVVEERIYTLQPGKVAEYFRIEADHGADIYLKTMGRVVGVFATEFGALNQIVHMVAFEDLADRAVRRATLRANPEWEAYARQVRPMIVAQENRLLMPAPFSPLR
jgi:NIPSNAP protein